MQPLDTPAKTVTYMTLATSLAAGNLVITAGNSTFNFALPAHTDATYASSCR